jgi:hypothetical protein
MVHWNDTVEEIPNYNETDDFWPDDFSNASQSMDDELSNVFATLDQDGEIFFESLDEVALDDLAREIESDKAFLDNMEDMPNRDSSDVDSVSSDGKKTGGFMAAGTTGLLSGAVAFLMRRIGSMRNKSGEDDYTDMGLDELVDVDDLQNAATSLGNNAYRASAESTRNGFGAGNVPSSTPPVGVESAA